MIDLTRIERSTLSTEPYEWAFIGDLFAPQNAAALVESYPRACFKTVKGYDQEKGYEYEARALVPMGGEAASHADGLSPAWRRLADDLLSHDYRAALTRLTGRDLTPLQMEANIFHYGAGAWLGPHVDLKERWSRTFLLQDEGREGRRMPQRPALVGHVRDGHERRPHRR